MTGGPARLVPPPIERGALAAAGQPEFTLDGARLRAFVAADASRVGEAFEQPDIQYFHSRRLDLAQASEWIRAQDTAFAEETSATWAIADTDDDRMLGRVSLHFGYGFGFAEIAYWMLPEGRGRSLVTGSCRLVVGWAHSVGIHRIELEHHPDNEPSRRVAEACGFTFEGIKREHHHLIDGRHDVWLWSHLAGEPLVKAG